MNVGCVCERTELSVPTEHDPTSGRPGPPHRRTPWSKPSNDFGRNSEQTDDVEGHRSPPSLEVDDADVEDHRRPPSIEVEDDVEGHRRPPSIEGDEGEVEGHRRPPSVEVDERDLQSHRLRVTDDGSEDVAGHVQPRGDLDVER